jgi:hypothetical protein
VKLFKKPKSRFHWFDFTVRGQRYRGSTGETKIVRATKVASMKLARAVEQGDLFYTKPTLLAEFSQRFQNWLDEVRLEEKTRKYYRHGCRLLAERTKSFKSDLGLLDDCTLPPCGEMRH